MSFSSWARSSPYAGLSAPKSRWGASKTLATAAAAAYGAVAIARPGGLHLVPPCPFRTLTGLDCPLCGATRGTRALVLDRDLAAAIDLNALYVLALPVAAAVLAVRLWNGRLPPWMGRRWTTLAIGALAVAFMVLRNLPIAPFDYLGT